SRWQTTYHGVIPGLERRTGTIARTVAGDGTVGFHLDLPGAQIDKVQALSASCGKAGRYCLGIGAGDLASFLVFTALPPGALCPELADENTRPPRELKITALSAESLDIGPEPNPILVDGKPAPFVDLP